MSITLKNILLVDDEPDIQDIIRYCLEKIGGFNVKICNSGYEALNILSEFKPDLILMDVMMPDMDGPTTLKKIRELPEFSNLPIIFVTAKIQSHKTEIYKDLGVIHTIGKPFNPLTLSDTIKDVWNIYYE